MANKMNGYESATTAADRRALFDLRRQLAAVAAGPAGPTGPAGPPGPSSATFYRNASGAISGHTIVKLVSGAVVPASNLDTNSRQLAVAMSLGAASSGNPVELQSHGTITEPSWSWTPGGMLYLGTAGSITQTMPTAPAFCRVLGAAITATEIWLDPQPPIILI